MYNFALFVVDSDNFHSTVMSPEFPLLVEELFIRQF